MTTPTVRALTGGGLVAASVVLLSGIGATDDVAPPTWIVASRDIPAGATLTESDLALAPMDLHDTTRPNALQDASLAIGSVTVGPIDKGDLVANSRIADASDPTSSAARRVTIDLPVADALGGDIAVPQLVDVVAVTPSASSVIARGVPVLSLDSPDIGGIGAASSVQLTLAVADEAEAIEVIDARRDGSIVLIATTTARGTNGGGSE